MNHLMIMYWGPGSLAGLIIAVIAIAVFVVVAMKIAKKDGANLEAILANVPEETKQQIINGGFTETDKKDFYTTNAYIFQVNEDGDKVTAIALFYAPEHGEFYDRKIKMSKADAQAKGVQAGAFVPALMKYDKEMHYFDYKKLV